MKKTMIVLLVCFCVVAFATTAKAIPLGVGGTVYSTGVEVPTGTLVASVIDAPFTANTNMFSGLLNQWVYENELGMLFVYRVSNNSGSIDPLDRVTSIDFTGFATDVDAGVSGVRIRRNTPSTIGFDIPIAQGSTSPLFWIQTNAHQYKVGTTNIIDGGIASVSTFAPTVPEPGTMFLLGSLATGLFGFAGLRKRFEK